jgi:hypothetical protein
VLDLLRQGRQSCSAWGRTRRDPAIEIIPLHSLHDSGCDATPRGSRACVAPIYTCSQLAKGDYVLICTGVHAYSLHRMAMYGSATTSEVVCRA